MEFFKNDFPAEIEFVEAHITDTRLMGVTGLYMQFKITDDVEERVLHQFFYFDAEEYGFENYNSLTNADQERVAYLENKLFGGLGGRKKELTLKEGMYLVQKYTEFNKKRNIPLPDNREEYDFLLKNPVFMSEPELYILMEKQSVKTESDYELINYFLMRTVGCDFPAALYLTTQDFDNNIFPEITLGTFLKNTIDETDTPGTYVNESLIEYGNNYYIATSETTVKGNLICHAECHSFFKISPYEAAIIMARPEFVSVYDFRERGTVFHRDSTELTKKAMVNQHDTGVLYMMFHDNNNHVKHKVYRLNEDVLGIYYVSDSGQLISTAYSLEEIKIMEQNIFDSPLRDQLLAVSKYEFPDTLLYEFIESDYGDFDTFVDAICHEDDNN